VADGFFVGGMSGDETVVVRALLTGGAEFQAEAAADAASIEELGAATRRSSAAADQHTKRSFLMSQAMFTLRRVVYATTLGIAALGAASVYAGLSFDASMQQNVVTMSHFLGSTTAARKELGILFNLAAHGPFTFSGITDAAKQFLAFGFSVTQANRYLKTIQDTASAFGGSQDVINRIVLALGQMQAKGRVMGQELLQLQEVGIPAVQILQKQLNLTDQQVANIGSTGIKASAAIPALIAGLNQRYGGLAEQQSKTFLGLLSTIRDYATQVLGLGLKPVFDYLQRTVLPAAAQITTALAGPGGKFQGGWAGALERLNASKAPFWFKALFGAVYQTTRAFQTLWPVIRPFAILIGGILLLALLAVSDTLGFLNRHADATRVVVVTLLPYMALWAALTLYQAYAVRILIARTVLLRLWALLIAIRAQYIIATTALELYTGATLLQSIRIVAWAAIQAAAIVVWELLTGAIAGATAAMTAFDIASFANPIGLIILGVLLLAAAFVTLYFKSKTFRDFIDNSVFPTLVSFVVVSITLVRALGNAFDDLKKKADFLPDIPGISFLHAFTGPTSPFGQVSGLATGLQYLTSDNSGTVKTKTRQHNGAIPAVAGGGGITIRVPLSINRKVLGEAVAQYNQDQKARQ
jgi:tape measure domain-containing protein